jgi:hypothetical protein
MKNWVENYLNIIEDISIDKRIKSYCILTLLHYEEISYKRALQYFYEQQIWFKDIDEVVDRMCMELNERKGIIV